MQATPHLGKVQSECTYNSYNTWLQQGGGVPIPPMRLQAEAGVPAIAVEECTAGITRLYGEEIWQTEAENCVKLALNNTLPKEGYRIRYEAGFCVEGADESGLLYGVFALLMRLAAGETPTEINLESAPALPRRMINHWDNMDGSIERGYAGQSIFYQNNAFQYSPARIRDYARMLASVGINIVVINNVNVTPVSARLITGELLPEVAQLAAIFRPYGIRLAISVHFDSPVMLGGLSTSDPLDPAVLAWWQKQTALVYQHIPDFSGFLVKADSEFNGGPGVLGRTQAEGANMLAQVLAPFGGTVYWRCFIYNCLQDWRDTKTDRYMAPYNLFTGLDGKFADNVVLQVKNGAADFQVREPNSPLLGAMRHTRQALEWQITQEYTGHQIDVYNLAVQWEEILHAPCGGKGSLQSQIGGSIDTIAAVVNVGNDENWTGHTLAQANLFAYGRFAWNPALTAKSITEEWIKLTFGNAPALVAGLTDIMMRSRGVYEKYNAPLGLGWMINPQGHYGPGPEGYEYAHWGTYHRANWEAIGVDRTSQGTGFAAQYPAEVAAVYDDVSTCPEELLLYFHRLPYNHKLKNGDTLLQHIYNSHFEGAKEAEEFITLWDNLQEWLPQEAWQAVRARLEKQRENAREWRDVINTYFYRKTGIGDEHGRKIYD